MKSRFLRQQPRQLQSSHDGSFPTLNDRGAPSTPPPSTPPPSTSSRSSNSKNNNNNNKTRKWRQTLKKLNCASSSNHSKIPHYQRETLEREYAENPFFFPVTADVAKSSEVTVSHKDYDDYDDGNDERVSQMLDEEEEDCSTVPSSSSKEEDPSVLHHHRIGIMPFALPQKATHKQGPALEDSAAYYWKDEQEDPSLNSVFDEDEDDDEQQNHLATTTTTRVANNSNKHYTYGDDNEIQTKGHHLEHVDKDHGSTVSSSLGNLPRVVSLPYDLTPEKDSTITGSGEDKEDVLPPEGKTKTATTTTAYHSAAVVSSPRGTTTHGYHASQSTYLSPTSTERRWHESSPARTLPQRDHNGIYQPFLDDAETSTIPSSKVSCEISNCLDDEDGRTKDSSLAYFHQRYPSHRVSSEYQSFAHGPARMNASRRQFGKVSGDKVRASTPAREEASPPRYEWEVEHPSPERRQQSPKPLVVVKDSETISTLSSGSRAYHHPIRSQKLKDLIGRFERLGGGEEPDAGRRNTHREKLASLSGQEQETPHNKGFFWRSRPNVSGQHPSSSPLMDTSASTEMDSSLDSSLRPRSLDMSVDSSLMLEQKEVRLRKSPRMQSVDLGDSRPSSGSSKLSFQSVDLGESRPAVPQRSHGCGF